MEESSKSQAPSSKEAPNPKLQTPQFQVGETVYSAISQDDRGMVVGIEITPIGYFYKVCWADKIEESSTHYAIELSREPLFTTPTR